MRRFAAVAITSGALVAGLTAAASPASAAPVDPARDGVPVSEVKTATLTGKAAAALNGDAKTKAVWCKTVTRTRGYKWKSNGRWIIYVQNKLWWCYNGSQNSEWKAKFYAWTYDRNTVALKGVGFQKLYPNKPAYTNVTSGFQYKFKNLRTGKWYAPYIWIRGWANGAVGVAQGG